MYEFGLRKRNEVYKDAGEGRMRDPKSANEVLNFRNEEEEEEEEVVLVPV